MVLGIVGKKGAGKDTFAKYVKAHAPHYQILHFAGRLKEICAQAFPVSSDYFHNPKLKEVPFDTPINVDAYLPCLRDLTDLNLEAKGHYATNPRHLLQLVGTEYVRSASDTYWLDYLQRKIEREFPDPFRRYVIVPDVRFINEASRVTTFEDGLLLRVVRTSQVSVDGHDSEREQEHIQCLSLYVKENELLLSEALACLFARGHVGDAALLIQRSNRE